MINVGRFKQLGDVTSLDGGELMDEASDSISCPQLLHMEDGWTDSWGKSDHKGFLDPMADEMLSRDRMRALLELLKMNFIELAEEFPERRVAVVDLDKIPRSTATVLSAFLASICYFKRVDFIYSENSYLVDGEELTQKLSTEEFWHAVYNFPSKLSSVPLLPGRFDASKPKSVFVNGGLDFGRVLHLAARWEPKEIHLTYPDAPASKKDPALISAFLGLIASSKGLSRLGLEDLVSALDDWYRHIDGSSVQPMLVCGGWKLQSVLSSIWAHENGRVPTFVCLPDFIVPDVSRVEGPRWKLSFLDTAVIV